MAVKTHLLICIYWILSTHIQDTVAYYDVEIDIVGRPSVQGPGNWDNRGFAPNGNDGNANTHYENGRSCTATEWGIEPWWQVDLGAQKSISRLEALNRGNCCPERLGPFDVLVSNDTYDVTDKPATILCGSHEDEVESGAWGTATCDTPVQGRYVIIKLPGSDDRLLTVCEVKVYARIQHTLSRVAAESDVNKDYATVVGQYINDEIAPIPGINTEVGTGYFSLQKSERLMFKSPLVDCAWDKAQTVQLSVLVDQKIRISFDFDTSLDKDNKSTFFGLEYLRSNTYADLTYAYFNETCAGDAGAFFSIKGHGPNDVNPQDRRFFVHCTYWGCREDWGWFVVLDMDHSKVCAWEADGRSNPNFLFAGGSEMSLTTAWSSGEVLLITADWGDAFGGCISDCVSLNDGNYQSCLACNIYVTCTSNSLKYKICQRGTAFDSSTGSCVESSSTCTEEGFVPEGCYPDGCSPNPCPNDGICSSETEGYSCTCRAGYKGDLCDVFDGCHNSPCQNNGDCTDADDSASVQYTCTCTSDYAGDECQNQKICSTSSPCENGNCVDGPDGTTYTCSCNSGYSGTNCDVFMGCTPNPCENGGTCSNVNDEAQCSCTESYNGDLCDEFDGCHNTPCKNNGDCTDADDSASVQYTCTCTSDYAGDECQNQKICSTSSPCENGNCVDGPDGTTYTCSCNSGYSGTNCDVFIGCTPNPCENGGTCSSDNNEVQCSCTAGHNGDVCDDIDACNSAPCQNDGTCSDAKDGGSVQYTCTCPADYAGDVCENQKICSASSPCENGICVDGSEGTTYSCSCNDGYSGTNCDQEDNQQGSAGAQGSGDEDSSDQTGFASPLTFYSLIAALAVAMLIISCLFIVAWRRKKKEQKAKDEHQERLAWARKKEMDNGPVVSQAQPPPAKVNRPENLDELMDF